jgi:hypothetical protein
LRSKHGKKSSEAKLPEMTTKEIMTMSEKLLTRLKETMAAISKKNAERKEKIFFKSSRKLTQQISEMVLQHK